MKGLGMLVVGAAVLGIGAVAFAKSKENEKKLTVVWDGQRWVYAEVRPDGIYPTNIPAPPVGNPRSQGRVVSGTYSP